jgi:hypothetical protein
MEKDARHIFEKRIRRERELQKLGNHGAASGVRHVDPALYQPPQQHDEISRPPAQAQIKTRELIGAADALLVADAKRRRGKRYGKRVREMIVAGRYR